MASSAAWARFSWNEPFIWKRFALGFALAAIPAIACLAQGWGIAALLLMAIGASPIPPRVSVSARGVACRWLFVEQLVPLSHLTSARLEPDPRRGALSRPTVLSLGRHGKPPLHIHGPPAVLHQLEQDLRRELALAGAPLLGDWSEGIP